jgi:hypothetical protein
MATRIAVYRVVSRVLVRKTWQWNCCTYHHNRYFEFFEAVDI